MDVLPFPREDALAPRHSSSATERHAWLDVVRVGGAMGVVVLHACVPYAVHRMPGLSWSVFDVPSRSVDWLMWSIELFIMPVFLVIAGFLVGQTLQRRGPGPLFRHRSSRLLKPLAFGLLVILPIDFYLWMTGWLSDGLIPLRKIRSLKFDGGLDEHLYGTSHLWFLVYLFLYVAITAALARIAKPFLARLRNALTSSAVPWALALIATATLCFRPEVVWGFQHAFLPVPSKFIYSGAFYAGGLWLWYRDPSFDSLGRPAVRWTLPILLTGFFAVLLGRWHLNGNGNGWSQTILAALTVAGAGGLTLLCLGVAKRWTAHVSRPIGYLAAASFWIYLIHHPIVALVHIDLKHSAASLPPFAKMTIAACIAIGFSLLTYEGLVRKTAFGRWLGMAWQIPTRATSPAPLSDTSPRHEPAESSRRAA